MGDEGQLVQLKCTGRGREGAINASICHLVFRVSHWFDACPPMFGKHVLNQGELDCGHSTRTCCCCPLAEVFPNTVKVWKVLYTSDVGNVTQGFRVTVTVRLCAAFSGILPLGGLVLWSMGRAARSLVREGSKTSNLRNLGLQ